MGKLYVLDAQHRMAGIQNRCERNDSVNTQIRCNQNFERTMLHQRHKIINEIN